MTERRQGGRMLIVDESKLSDLTIASIGLDLDITRFLDEDFCDWTDRIIETLKCNEDKE